MGKRVAWMRFDTALKHIPPIAARIAGHAVRLVEAAQRFAPPRPGNIAVIVVNIGERYRGRSIRRALRRPPATGSDNPGRHRIGQTGMCQYGETHPVPVARRIPLHLSGEGGIIGRRPPVDENSTQWTSSRSYSVKI